MAPTKIPGWHTAGHHVSFHQVQERAGDSQPLMDIDVMYELEEMWPLILSRWADSITVIGYLTATKLCIWKLQEIYLPCKVSSLHKCLSTYLEMELKSILQASMSFRLFKMCDLMRPKVWYFIVDFERSFKIIAFQEPKASDLINSCNSAASFLIHRHIRARSDSEKKDVIQLILW